ncbi:uncharacterized protein LOC106067491 isoform X2 [Biomphalaria glabrata]|uniref:Uncharacterized protein LOC106067491 isoform X2 n=1 Tax=Biomphalaria glabrata TaxID=6526 RepID=A0A9W3BDQ0_BIOGL|nr:uncharacterized protein LOC106067491 isoform X2 [Biomphalaria glabrata]
MLTTLTIFLVITPACMTQTTDLPLVNPLEPLKCYLCGENNGPSFPDCLSTNISCHKNEVCSIRYTAIESETSIKCQNKTVCDIEICHANARCVPGGYQIYPGQCEVCCNTTECVDRVVRNVKPTQPPNHTIRCMSCNGSECNNSLNLTVCNTGYCSQNVVYSGTTVLQTVKGPKANVYGMFTHGFKLRTYILLHYNLAPIIRVNRSQTVAVPDNTVRKRGQNRRK